jgi:prolyl-tRNA editing enzyme YbaK/EbsC (Cys-tRNA(Pro) deacylase)
MRGTLLPRCSNICSNTSTVHRFTTLVDTWLARHPQVWAAAGHPHSVFSTTYAELLELTGGRAVDVER